MSLATRCIACGTVFRVVQDQLKVSEGWVRCGRCNEVFNALDSLVELDSGRPTKSAAIAAMLGKQRAEHAADHAGARPADDDLASVHSMFEESRLARDAGESDWSPSSMPPTTPGAADDAPDFVRQAERAEFWRRPVVRGTLAGLVVASAAALVAQVALEYRDLVASRWPDARPALDAACGLLDCTVEAPRLIDELTVESSGLAQLAGAGRYRLSLVLRNHAPTAVAPPAVDLVLTDLGGAVIARRVVALGEFGWPQRALAPEQELALQAVLAVAERPVAGYTIEIFYP